MSSNPYQVRIPTLNRASGLSISAGGGGKDPHKSEGEMPWCAHEKERLSTRIALALKSDSKGSRN